MRRAVWLALFGAASLFGSVVAATAGTFTVLHNFTGNADGAVPSPVTVDPHDTIYGQTSYGGVRCHEHKLGHALGCGVIYRIDGHGRFNVLHKFLGGKSGAIGVGTLNLQGNKLFGTTYFGGEADDGTVFSVNTDGSDFTVLHQFIGSDGFEPLGRLVIDASQNIYGVALRSSHGNGVLYRLSPAGIIVILHQFKTLVDGSGPNDLTQDASGNLIGLVSGINSEGYCSAAYRYSPGDGVFNFFYRHTQNSRVCNFDEGTVGHNYELYAAAATPSASGIVALRVDASTEPPHFAFQFPDEAGVYSSLPIFRHDVYYGVVGQALYQYGGDQLSTLHVLTDAEGMSVVALAFGRDGVIDGSAEGGGSGPCNENLKPQVCGTVFQYEP